MTKVLVAGLIGQALDYAVARAEGYQSVYAIPSFGASPLFQPNGNVEDLNGLRYSTDWLRAGPIIFHAKIETAWIITDDQGGGYWRAQCLLTDTYGYMGATPIIAAMRCHVAIKFGKYIDIPESLIRGDSQ